MLPTLRELDAANQYQTDKLGRCPVNRHDYCDAYEFHFGRFRDRPITFWEIGVDRGDSLRMWSDYFPLATIVGLDIKPPTLPGWKTPPRTVFALCNATDPKAVADLAAAFPPDIVLDDGSHREGDLLAAFSLIYPRAKMLYAVEDLGTQLGLNGPDYLINPQLGSSVLKGYRLLSDELLALRGGLCQRLCYEPGQVYIYKK